MLLQEAYTKVAEKTGLDSSSTNDKAKIVRAIRAALKAMFRRGKFIALLDEASLTTVDGTYLYYLDPRYLYGLRFVDRTSTTSSATLQVYTRRRWEKDYPNPAVASTDEAEPSIIVPLKKIWVTAQPTSASVIATVSSSASDTSTYGVIRGIVSGVERSERITMNGTTSVNSSLTYTSLISITKDETVGTWTCTSNSGAVTNISLLPGETQKEVWQVRLHPVPDDAYTYYYQFFRKPWDFDDNDEELIPFEDDFEDALVIWTTGIILKDQGDNKWKDTITLARDTFDEIRDNGYYSEDEDARMSLIELDNMQEDW